MSSILEAAGAPAVFAKAVDSSSAAVPLAFIVARVGLVGTLLVAPLVFGGVQTWVWASLAVSAALLLLLWGVGCAQQRVLRFVWSPLYIPAALFFLLGVVQLFGHFTLDPIATREALIKLATNFLFFFLAGQLGPRDSPQSWRRFGLLVTIFAFALAVFAILQFFSSQGLIYWSVKTEGWSFGPYVNHNHFAGLMEMLIPVSVAYFLSRPRRHPGRTLLVFMVSIAIASLLLSGSRGGMISLLGEVSILAAMVISHAAAPDWRKLGIVLPIGILAASLIFFWLDPGEISGRLATVVKLSRSTDVGFIQREAAALDSLRILCHQLGIGAGMGSFETVYAQYRSFPSDLVWEHAHNDYAEALVESGLVGGILLLGALIIFGRLSFRDLADRMRSEGGQIQLGAALGCCGLLIHGLVDFNFHIPANAAWFAVCAAGATRGIATAKSFARSLHFDSPPGPPTRVSASCHGGLLE